MCRGIGFQSLVVSVDADADLLDAANWTMSNKLPFDPAWVPKNGENWSVRVGWKAIQ